jgi:hypothetical protein
MIRLFLCSTILFGLAACGAEPTATPNPTHFASMSTDALWADQANSQSPQQLAFVEAELGARGQTANGSAYLGLRTASAFGKALYSRTGGESGSVAKACSDFGSSAEAQRFFLSTGGPLSDPANLDGDGDGLACEWGTTISHVAKTHRVKVTTHRAYAPRHASSGCYTGPRGGRYTISASGRKNYGGC